uniref:Uncharacterized protein n=1 Tax=Cucumis melo TaxID=3656 RepID=A0A9I9EHB2_CUCME
MIMEKNSANDAFIASGWLASPGDPNQLTAPLPSRGLRVTHQLVDGSISKLPPLKHKEYYGLRVRWWAAVGFRLNGE